MASYGIELLPKNREFKKSLKIAISLFIKLTYVCSVVVVNFSKTSTL